MTRCWTPPWVCTGPGAPRCDHLRHRRQHIPRAGRRLRPPDVSPRPDAAHGRHPEREGPREPAGASAAPHRGSRADQAVGRPVPKDRERPTLHHLGARFKAVHQQPNAHTSSGPAISAPWPRPAAAACESLASGPIRRRPRRWCRESLRRRARQSDRPTPGSRPGRRGGRSMLRSAAGAAHRG